MTSLSSYQTFVPVVKAEVIGLYRLLVTFADDRSGTLDLTGLVGEGPWRRLADPAFFGLAHAEYDTVVWTDDVDLAPEYVYDHVDWSEPPTQSGSASQAS